MNDKDLPDQHKPVAPMLVLRKLQSIPGANDFMRLSEQLGIYTVMGCDESLKKFITRDPAMLKVKERVRVLSKVNINQPVFIHGPTGTGKELIAQALHGNRTGKFIPINCAAIPSELIESELFGHIKGSFTSAFADKAGMWEFAANGTLFLDEVADLPMLMQAKLLRVLQENKIRPIGSNSERAVNARIICASHKDLHTQVQHSLFREDLYYRLCTFVIRLSPLRNRAEDIEEILGGIDGGNKLTQEQIEKIKELPLQGNVRELQRIVARLTIEGEDNE